ncbi:hypothetical protein SEVIR_4G171200v4 [Setaria viridis]|uniref:Alpha/beta hydrolase fold-3 domain-containing protein n=1 Tax=Setaria viridis TaxID=4556 RepID=A0A4U6V3A6_SETVI|nr:probable carboxylesterase 12 [Setaria viridis]TKW21259.1 hypothetical protein SEVIR_4G171200v2 [Setaria viridis]
MLANKSSSPAGQNAVSEVTIDLPLKILVYKNGRIEGVLRSPFVPASEDPGITGVATRDAVVDRETGVAARLFLPTRAVITGRRLSLVVFFHGGSLIAAAESAFCQTYHRYATSLAARAGAIVVSVEYRLPPEHPTTAAHDDAWNALRWAASLADPWLLYHADRRCTFLAGDGAGGDIAYRTAVRASRAGDDIDVEGLLLMDPYFWEPGWLPHEKAGHGGFLTPAEIAQLPCRRALVAVAEKGAGVRERGRRLAARMRGCWWGGEVTIVELHGEDHGFHLYGPESAGTERLMESIVEFVNKERDQSSMLRDKKEVPSGVLDGAEVAPSLSNGSRMKAVPVDVPRRTMTKSCL